MIEPLVHKSATWLLVLAFYCSGAAAQQDAPLVQGSQRIDEMKRMIREFIDQAQQLEDKGDKAGAILMKNKARGLIKSLRSMNPTDTGSGGKDPRQTTPETPTVTKAEAVVTLENAIKMLNLLGEKELGRRINIVMNGLASEKEIQEILDYEKRMEKSTPSQNLKTTTQSKEKSSKTTAAPSQPATPTPSREQIQNQVLALQTGMNALLDSEQTEDAKSLAQSIMLRNRALKASEFTWDYPPEYTLTREIEILRIASKRLFESGNIAQSKMVSDLSDRLQIEQRNQRKKSNTEMDEPSENEGQQNAIITRLTEEYQKSEAARLKIQFDLQTLRRKNSELKKELEALQQKSGKSK